MQNRFAKFRLVAIVFSTLVLSACPEEEVDLEDFPPMANDNPPGASAKANLANQALGRGVNFDRMFEWTTVGVDFPEADLLIAKAREGGFQTIRLPVRWNNHAGTTSPYTIDSEFFAQVESVVDAALHANFYVVLNMHHYRQLDGDAIDNGDVTVDPALVDVRFLTLWRQIAKRFGNKSDRLLFELYNEPHGRLTDAKWNDLIARALNTVRQTNPNRIVLIGSTVWNTAGALSELRLPNDPNLIVTIHNYEPFNFTHQGAPWLSPPFPTGVTCCTPEQEAQILAPLDVAERWSQTHRYPVFVGEFGAYRGADMPSRVNFTRFARDRMEERGMTWAYWEMASDFGVYDNATHTWNVDLLTALMAR